MVRVLLAVTHELLRAALQEHLLLPGEFIYGEVASVEALWRELSHAEWNILILDMCLPGQTKLQTVRTLHERYPAVSILAMSFSIGVALQHWQEAGASGFVSKANLGAELLEAVRVISKGGTYFGDEGPEEKIP